MFWEYILCLEDGGGGGAVLPFEGLELQGCSHVIRLVSLVSLALYNINCSDTYNQVHIFLFYRNPRKFLFPARHNTISKLNAGILVFGTGGKSIMIGQGITKRMLKQNKSSLPPIEKIPETYVPLYYCMTTVIGKVVGTLNIISQFQWPTC